MKYKAYEYLLEKGETFSDLCSCLKNLTNANLRYANLINVDLINANLTNANLTNANLTNANLDFSSFPLWCGSFDIIVDDRLISQLLYHILRLKNPLVKKIKKIKTIIDIANNFHVTEEYGEIKE